MPAHQPSHAISTLVKRQSFRMQAEKYLRSGDVDGLEKTLKTTALSPDEACRELRLIIGGRPA